MARRKEILLEFGGKYSHYTNGSIVVPLLWISVFFIAGLYLGRYLPWHSQAWFGLAGALAFLWVLLRRLHSPTRWLSRIELLAQVEPHLFVPPLLLAAALFAGAGRMAASSPDASAGHIIAYNDAGKARIMALVVAPPDRGEKSTLLRLRVEQVTPLDGEGRLGEARPAHGLIQVILPPGAGWQYGDRLSLEGSPETPPEDEEFSYRDYLSRQNVYSYLAFPRVRLLERNAGSPALAVIYRMRDKAYTEIYHLFPSPEAPLLAGILLGIDRDLPDGVARAFQDTGTAHVIAISGFNIAILVQLFMKLFSMAASRWWAMLASILAIAVYTILVGGTPSVVRAAWMGSMALIADQIGRRSTGANSLGITAAVMCLGNPHLPWDVSFQLSFMATLGLILYGERMQSGFERLLEGRLPAEQAKRIAAPVGEYFLMTLAAQSLTLPVILYHFQRLSISALLANPLVLPVQPLLMTLSGAAVLAGTVLDPLAHVLGGLAWPLSAYTIRIVELLAKIPGGAVSIGEPGLGGLFAMLLAALLPLFRERLPNLWKSALKPVVILSGAALLTVVMMRMALTVPDGRMRLLVFNIQGNPVVLLRAPHGETLLIGGGSSAPQLSDQLGRWLPPFDRTIDALILNDPAAASMSSLPAVLERYSVRQAFWGCAPPETRTARDVTYALEDGGTAAHTLRTGEGLLVGEHLRLTALVAKEEGSALFIEYGNFRAILPAGVSPDTLTAEKLAGAGLLLLSDRDFEKTTPEQWQEFSPQAAIVTSPAPALSVPEHWLATRPGDWLAITTDGVEMWLERNR